MTKVIVAPDSLNNISAGQLDVGHAMIVDCDAWSIQIGFPLLYFIPIVVLHHGPLHPVHDGDGVPGDTLLVGLSAISQGSPHCPTTVHRQTC